MSSKKSYSEQFDVSLRARWLAGAHYETSYASRYWGRKGAIRIAKHLAEELEEEAQILESKMLMLSTYYSAAGAAFVQWKAAKWNLVFFWRLIYDTLCSLHSAKSVLELSVSKEYWYRKDAEAWDALTLNMNISQLEVLMSPFWGVATRALRVGLFRKERFLAEMIGRQAYSMQDHGNDMAFALVAGKLMMFARDDKERLELRLAVARVADDESFSVNDRARLYVLLGEPEKARILGEQQESKDVVLKSSI